MRQKFRFLRETPFLPGLVITVFRVCVTEIYKKIKGWLNYITPEEMIATGIKTLS